MILLYKKLTPQRVFAYSKNAAIISCKSFSVFLKLRGEIILKIVSIFTFLILSCSQVYAACTVNGVSYREINDNSGTYITLDNLKSRSSNWNNQLDIVTSCDVSKFTSMSGAFFQNRTFNQDLSAWDVSSVTDMSHMFAHALSLTSMTLQDTSSVTNMSYMFFNAARLKSVSLPDTSSVTNMSNMFNFTLSLTSVSFSDTSSVTDMRGMFMTSYIESVSLPDTSSVTNMSNMFATSKIKSVSLPDTSSVTNMSYMFSEAHSFDQDIRNWNVSSVDDFNDMFRNALAMISTYRSTPHWDTTPTREWFDAAPSNSASIDSDNSTSDNTASDNTADNSTKTQDIVARTLDDIENTLAANARTQLNHFTTSTSSIVGSARSRFMNTAGATDSADTALRGNASTGGVDLKGSTKHVTTTDDGKATAIIEGQYQYTETKDGLKSQNASVQVIWEKKLSNSLTFGHFLGATLGDGQVVGTNNADIGFIGAEIGAYMIANTKGGLVFDTYFAGSIIENQMSVATSLMTADSKYYKSMLTTGASITGTLQVKNFEIRPTLSTDVSYMFGETAYLDVSFGSATSLEQASYGEISKAQVTFAPEFRLPFDESSALTATPSVKCRYRKQGTVSESCGQGLSLGFSAKSNDGFNTLTANAGIDRAGNEETRSINLQFERKF